MRLSDFGFPRLTQPVRGGPVEAAVTPDQRHAYVLDTLKIDQAILVGSVPTGAHPIGITYVNATREMWVACYSGRIMVFRDR